MLMGVASTVVTSIFSVYRFISEKKECKEKNAKREEIYTKYLLDTRKKIYRLRSREEETYSYVAPKISDVVSMVNSYSSRIYEKTATDADFMFLTVGYRDGESAAAMRGLPSPAMVRAKISLTISASSGTMTRSLSFVILYP